MTFVSRRAGATTLAMVVLASAVFIKVCFFPYILAKMKKEVKPVKPEQHERKNWLLAPVGIMHHPRGVLLTEAIVFVVLLLLTLLVNNFLSILNWYSVFFIRPGSLLLLFFSIATLCYVFKILSHGIHAIARLRTVYRFILFVLVVIAAALIFLNQSIVVPYIAKVLGLIPWSNLNPLTFVIY